LKKKEESGEFDSQSEEDILSRALGKKDHPGRVVGYGTRVSRKVAFGHDNRRSKHKIFEDVQAQIDIAVKEARAQTIKEMEEKMEAMFQERFRLFSMQFGLTQPPSQDLAQSTMPEPLLIPTSNVSGVSDPFQDIQVCFINWFL